MRSVFFNTKSLFAYPYTYRLWFSTLRLQSMSSDAYVSDPFFITEERSRFINEKHMANINLLFVVLTEPGRAHGNKRKSLLNSYALYSIFNNLHEWL